MEETLRILVVDDDESNCRAVHQALIQGDLCLELDEVRNSVHAFCALQKTNYDCVFLNYRLIEKYGLNLIEKLRSAKIKLPIVVLNVPRDKRISSQLIPAGATDYLLHSNSLVTEVLAQVLRNAIRIHQVQMEVELANKRLLESNIRITQQNQELDQQKQYIHTQNLKILEISGLKSQFLATISHELRTPMNAIIGFSQILLRGKFGQLTQQQSDMLERILNNGRHLLMLVNEILDFTRLEAGKLALKSEIFDLSKLVNSIVAEIYPSAESKKLFLLVKLEIQNSLVVNDPVRVRQILTNLLSNAIKFTESGGIWVELIESSTNTVTLTVRDTGIGISPADQERIFEAFQQVDQSITRKFPGTGMGLAVINALLRVMGGKIFLESQLGVGSVFKVELPRQVILVPPVVDSSKLNLDSEGVFYAPHLAQPQAQSSQARMGYLNLKP